MNVENLKLRQMLAAEYALGTLRGLARRRLDRLARKDTLLRAEITFWEARLDELNRDLKPVEPPPAVWLGVQHRMETAAPKVSTLRAPQADTPKPAKPASLWRIGAGLATAAAIVVAVLFSQRNPTTTVAQQTVTPPKPEAPGYVAMLKLPESSLQWTLSLAPERGRVNIAASGEYAQLGAHSLELWVITADGPVAIGVLPVSGAAVLTLPANFPSGDTITLAISLEPVGGSPTGKPTGPVLTSGPAVKAA